MTEVERLINFENETTIQYLKFLSRPMVSIYPDRKRVHPTKHKHSYRNDGVNWVCDCGRILENQPINK